MIKEAIDKILSLQDDEEITVDGRSYYKNGYNEAKPPLPETVDVMNLDGVISLVKFSVDKNEITSSCIAVVESPTLVSVRSELDDEWRSREQLIRGSRDRRFEPFNFGEYMPTDQLIVGLKSRFVSTGPLEDLVKLIGNISAETSITENDDGFSQTVQTRAGVHLKATETIPNPICLKPFRTFTEVDQPESLFLVRAREGRGGHPEFALFEADGGAWKIAAIKSIKEYLSEQLPDCCAVIG
jgi:hypothetical protein